MGLFYPFSCSVFARPRSIRVANTTQGYFMAITTCILFDEQTAGDMKRPLCKLLDAERSMHAAF